MILCTQSIIVLFLSITSYLSYLYVFRGVNLAFNITVFIIQVISTIIAVLITNWSCKSYNYKWVSWAVVIYQILLTIWGIIQLNDKNYIENIKKQLGNNNQNNKH
jgi:hypothetical protein